MEHIIAAPISDCDAPDPASLADRLAQGPLPLQSALRYAAEVAGTLRQLHGEGRFHGDVEPASIRITDAGAFLLPPNGHAHLATARSDISEFGSLLYQMLTGSKPDGTWRGVAMDAGRETVRFAATRLAARCLGAAPDPPADIQKVSTEVRLLGLLARQRGAEVALPAVPAAPAEEAAIEAVPEAAAVEEIQAEPAPEAAASAAAVEAAAVEALPEIHDPEDVHPPSESGERCPRCGAYLTSASRPRSAFEAVLSTFHVPIRRCRRCFHRYVIFLGLPIERAAHA